MNKARKAQLVCILLMVIGCFGMGVHLFLQDGITHPTHVLTVFAVIFGVGLFGNLICALWRLSIEEKRKENSDQ